MMMRSLLASSARSVADADRSSNGSASGGGGGGGGSGMSAEKHDDDDAPATINTLVLEYADDYHLDDAYLGPPYPDFTQLTGVHAAFVALYVIVIVLSVLGNSLVCLTVFRNKKMHTAVNYYIVNLGLSDLMVGLFVMPVKLIELAAPSDFEFHLNDALCTVTMYFQTVFVFCSVLTLVATCVERYFAIVHPLESRMHHSKSRAKSILLCVWVASGLVATPFFYPASAQANRLYSDYGVVDRLTCFDGFSEHFRRAYFLLLFVLVYLLPLIFIGGTCAAIFKVLLGGIPFHRQGSLRRQENNRRKVAKMVMMVAVAYAVSWTPYFSVTLVSQLQSDSFLHRGQFLFTMLSINLFAFANSCVNPFIYAAMSVRFRHGFRSIFHLMLTCGVARWRDQSLEDERGQRKSDLPSRLKLLRGTARSSSSSDTPHSAAGMGTASNNNVNVCGDQEQQQQRSKPAAMPNPSARRNHSSTKQDHHHDKFKPVWSRSGLGLRVRAIRFKRNFVALFQRGQTKRTIAAPPLTDNGILEGISLCPLTSMNLQNLFDEHGQLVDSNGGHTLQLFKSERDL